MKNFSQLKVWQKAHDLILEIYRMTRKFPKEERFGLIQQMRRASVSIAANIAEGAKRRSDRDFSHFLNMAEGSLEKLKYYFVLSRDLVYINAEESARLLAVSDEVGKMLSGFIKKLRT